MNVLYDIENIRKDNYQYICSKYTGIVGSLIIRFSQLVKNVLIIENS